MRNTDNCFPLHDGKCVLYGGRLFPDTVKYLLGDSTDEVIEKLTSYVLTNKKPFEEKSVDVSALSHMSSTCVGKLQNTSFSYSIEAKSTSAEISFNFKETTDNLPYGFNTIKSGAEMITSNGDIVNLKGSLNGVSLSPSDFPLNVKFYVSLNTSCGLIELSKNVKTYLEPSNVLTDFNIQDFGDDNAQSSKTTSEAIKMISEKLVSLDKKIDNRTKVKNGQTVGDYIFSIDNDLNSTLNSVSNLQEEIDSSSIFSNVETINEKIDALIISVNKLTSEQTTLKTKVEQIQRDIST
jgi:hypothetical protein